MEKYPKAILREALWNIYNGACGYCGKSIELQDFDIEHIVPKYLLDFSVEKRCEILAKNGLSEDFNIQGIENLYVSCPGCNSKKSKRLFIKGSLAIHLQVAFDNKNKVLGEIRRIEKSKFKAEFYLGLMSDFEKNGLASDIGTHFNQLEQIGGSFRLSSPVQLFGETNHDFLTLEKFDEYLDLKLDYSWLDGGLKLVDDVGKEEIVTTLREYDKASRRGFFAFSNTEMKIEEYCFRRPLEVLKVLLKSKPPRQSYIARPRKGLADIGLLPISLLCTFGPQEDHLLDGTKTIGELVIQGKARIDDIGTDFIRIKYNEVWTFMHEITRTDVDGDGNEDILVHCGGGPVDGTFSFGERLAITRQKEEENFSIVSLPF